MVKSIKSFVSYLYEKGKSWADPSLFLARKAGKWWGGKDTKTDSARDNFRFLWTRGIGLGLAAGALGLGAKVAAQCVSAALSLAAGGTAAGLAGGAALAAGGGVIAAGLTVFGIGAGVGAVRNLRRDFGWRGFLYPIVKMKPPRAPSVSILRRRPETQLANRKAGPSFSGVAGKQMPPPAPPRGSSPSIHP